MFLIFKNFQVLGTCYIILYSPLRIFISVSFLLQWVYELGALSLLFLFFFLISYLSFWTAWVSYLISLCFTFGICKTGIIITSTYRVVLKIKQSYICKVFKTIYKIYVLKMVTIPIIAASSCFYYFYSFLTWYSA